MKLPKLKFILGPPVSSPQQKLVLLDFNRIPTVVDALQVYQIKT